MAYLMPLIGRRQKISRRAVHLRDLSDEECCQLTRFPRSAIQELCEMLSGDLRHPTDRSNALSADTQLLAALQLYSSGSFQWMIARSCGISQPSVSLAVESVTKALVRRAPEFINFSTDRARIIHNKLAFYNTAGFPNVLGAIDGTHIAIKAPSQYEEAFVNRKGVHTINVQAVVDPEMQFLNIVAKWPGSSHDSFIWRNCALRTSFQQGQMPDGWLLGEFESLHYLVF